MMPHLYFLHFVLLIIFQVSFSFNLLVAIWRLSPNIGHQIFFPLAMTTKMVATWSADAADLDELKHVFNLC